MSEWPKPFLIEFSAIGKSDIGYISVAENPNLPFKIERVFWTFYTPQEIIRGRHAHHQLQQILIAASGTIRIQTESKSGETNEFLLDKPSIGLYMPPDHWHTMQYSHSAVQLTLASLPYSEEDYIRDYKQFRRGI